MNREEDFEQTDLSPLPLGSNWTRRDLFRASAAMGVSALLLPAAGCSSSSPGSSSSSGGPSSSGAPSPSGGSDAKRGGTLRVGILGGSSGDTVEASANEIVPDWPRNSALYSTLLVQNKNGEIMPSLAERVEASPDATTYTIHLRPDVTFHNGKPVTPEDVIFSMRQINKKKFAASAALAPVNFSNIRVMDKHTLRLKLDKPSVLFRTGLASQGAPVHIIPVGYDVKNPVGTGPFMFDSFTPGQRSVFKRNPHYFREGLPYLDSLEILDFPDVNARLNAFLSGQLDAIDAVPAAQIPALKGHNSVVIDAKTGLGIINYMRTDVAPFNDKRVRLAMKLIMDRAQMIEVAGHGQGAIGNDLLGKFFPSYDDSLPQRNQDLDHARSLLKQAGRSDMTIKLATANFTAGAPEQAALLAQFAKKAGFTIELDQTTTGNLFGPKYAGSGSNYASSWVFAQDFFSGKDYLEQSSITMGPHASDNLTHFANDEFNSLFNQANSTSDDAKRYELIHRMQQIDYDEGGLLLPYFSTITDAYSSQFTGFEPAGVTGYSFNDYDFSGVSKK